MTTRESAVGAALAEHQPTLGLFDGVSGIVGCSCLSARHYRAAGHKAGRDGWRAHLTAAVLAALDSAPQPALGDDERACECVCHRGVVGAHGGGPCICAAARAHQPTPPAQAEAAAVERVRALCGDNAIYADFGEPPNQDVVPGVRESDLRAALAPTATAQVTAARAIADAAAGYSGT